MNREPFEKWLLEEQGLQSEWQPERNCYKDFACHLAWKAWQAALLPEAADAKDIARYRWLKKMHDAGDEQWFVYGAKSENLDAEIDAAIGSPQSQPEKP